MENFVMTAISLPVLSLCWPILIVAIEISKLRQKFGTDLGLAIFLGAFGLLSEVVLLAWIVQIAHVVLSGAKFEGVIGFLADKPWLVILAAVLYCSASLAVMLIWLVGGFRPLEDEDYEQQAWGQ